jgi:polyhydroxyalkanoate synthase
MDLTTVFADWADSWWGGALRTLGAMQRSFGAAAQDPHPVTPYTVIYEGGRLSLRHYRAAGSACSTPIMLVYSLIKRPFVLDLAAGNSVVENLIRQGFEVFLTDWLPPKSADSWRGFDAYVNQDLAGGVRAIRLHTGIERVTVLGYCLGALLGVIYAALHSRDVKNLVTLTLPLDMSAREPPAYSLIDWFDEQAVESLTTLYGNCPAWLLSALFSSAMPLQRMLNKYMGLELERFNERERYTKVFPTFRYWLESEVPIAGALFRELITDVYRKNSLARGVFKVGSKVMDLKRITSPVLNVVADFDVVVDPRSSVPLIELIGSADATNLRFPTGHLGIALGEEAHTTLWPQIGQWLRAHDN